MTDESVKAALLSDSPLVVIEAPAGCGKTHQGAEYARETAQRSPEHRLLVLTHTHAACSVFSNRTKGVSSRVEIRTIDSVIMELATAYHAGLGLPRDVIGWVRQRRDGYADLAQKAAALLARYPAISSSLAWRYLITICDEHQDSSGAQHAIVESMLDQGARIRIFADPMQKIFREDSSAAIAAYNWSDLTQQADAFEKLDFPHRWSKGCSELGCWILKARASLESGGVIDLRTRPQTVSVVFAENEAMTNLDYQVSRSARVPIDNFVNAHADQLILTRHNQTARSIRSFFNRRIALWEGHTRFGLEKLATALRADNGTAVDVAAAIVRFLDDVGKGFSPSAFGNRFEQEAREGCTRRARGKPAKIQELARFLTAEPNHHGMAKVLSRIAELKDDDGDFGVIEIDHYREFREAIQLGDFPNVLDGLTALTHRRTYSRPEPPNKAISTIHKAKGLECGHAIIMPCDAKTFPDKPISRCLLYVALSRAKHHLMLVLSRTNPSPLFSLPATADER